MNHMMEFVFDSIISLPLYLATISILGLIKNERKLNYL